MDKKIKKKCKCGTIYFVRPQHVKISKRCPECQKIHTHEKLMDMQRKRRHKSRLINNK